MAVGQTTQQYVSYDQWSEALLDELLPACPNGASRGPVLLACDDDAIVRAGVRLGYDPEDACRRLGRTVELRYHIGNRGSIEGVRRPTVQFNASSTRSSTVPPFLAVCAVMVLAASRMTADENSSTAAYYKRLWEVLDARPGRSGPYEFDYAPYLFKYLAQWLDRDLDGRRGLLILRPGGPSQIGCAINQCLFRQRDKEHLAEFFAHRVRGDGEHLDLLRLLQVSSDRHLLTQRALAVISASETQSLARAALEQTYRQWDGTVPDSHGGRSWLGALHLAVNRRVRLSVSVPSSHSEEFSHPTDVPLDSLSELADHGMRFSRAGERGIFLPATGETLIFELHEDMGLAWVRAPSQETVWVLSRDRELQRSLADYLACGRGVADLPNRWQLFERVPADRIPFALLTHARMVRPPVALAGGLRLPGGWLVGFPPQVEVGDVDEPLAVRVGGEFVGSVGREGQLQLELPEGDHRVEVGDGLVAYTVHMLQRNPSRPPYGELACSLDARGLRTGASRAPREPFVCGAAMSGVYAGPVPQLIRARCAFLITGSGVGLRSEAPTAPHWLRAVGLDPEVARWELEAEEDVAWALVGTTAVMLRDEVPPALDQAAAAAVRALGPRPIIRAATPALRDRARVGFAALAELAESEGAL